jgi:LuxR family maltose regulon positive regulatory protein
VLAQLDTAVQEVLLRLSLLEPFSAEVGSATLGGDITVEQVQVLLDEWERSNLFVVPLDARQGWYRYHHLFRAVLEQRLQARVSTEEIATLHQRASGWSKRNFWGLWRTYPGGNESDGCTQGVKR